MNKRRERSMLQERILQTLEKRGDVDQRKLSRIAKTNESSISRYLNGYEEINFEAVLRIVQHLFPEQEKELMAEYIMTQKSKNARYALEYCAMNQLFEQLDHLLKELSVSSNPIDKEWASMYELIKIRNSGALDPLELLKQVEIFKPKQLEMEVMKVIIKGYIYGELNDFHTLSMYVPLIENELDHIKSNFIRSSYKVRLGLMMNYISLFKNDVEKARFYSNLVLDQVFFEQLKPIAYHHLGHSYLFEDYEKSMSYLDLSLKLSYNSGFNDMAESIKFTIEFVKSFWGIDHEFRLELTTYKHKMNYAHFLFQKGEKDKAREVLDQLDFNSLPDWEKGFYFYYKGLIENDIDLFHYSVRWFKKEGDLFHMKLPILKLKHLGEKDIILENYML